MFPPLSNSMRRKEMGSNAWQYSECKCVKKRGRKRHPQIVHNIPGGTQCCKFHTWWLQKKGRSFMEVVNGWGHARTSLHKASIPRSGVCPAEKVKWKVKFTFTSLLSFQREDQDFSLRAFASWNAGVCGNKARVAEGKVWGELELTFQ